MISTATANPVLTGIFNQFMRDPAGFVAETLLPTFNTAEPSARYYVFKRENLLHVPQNIERAPGAPHQEITALLSDDSYTCINYGLKMPVPDEMRKKYGSYLDADVAAVRRISDILKVNREIRVKNAVTNTGVVPNASPATKWDVGGSDPKVDVDAAKEAIRIGCGMRANTMVISESVRLVLQTHAKIIDLFKYTTPGVLSEDLLAAYFGVQRLVVAGTVLASSKEGQAVTAADIWSDNVVLAHVEPGQDLMLPNFGRTFNWTGVSGGSEPAVKTWRDDDRGSDMHSADQALTEKLTATPAGYVLTNVLAA